GHSDIYSPFVAGERRNKIAEAVALDDDMASQEVSRGIRFSCENCLHDAGMFGERRLHSVSNPQLKTAIGPQTTVQSRTLVVEEAAVAGLVDGVMEPFIVVIIGICIAIGCR